MNSGKVEISGLLMAASVAFGIPGVTKCGKGGDWPRERTQAFALNGIFKDGLPPKPEVKVTLPTERTVLKPREKMRFRFEMKVGDPRMLPSVVAASLKDVRGRETGDPEGIGPDFHTDDVYGFRGVIRAGRVAGKYRLNVSVSYATVAPKSTKGNMQGVEHKTYRYDGPEIEVRR